MPVNKRLSGLPIETSFAQTDYMVKVKAAGGGDVLVLLSDFLTAIGFGAWTSFTPGVTNITVGNGNLVGRYMQVGKSVTAECMFTLGTTSAVGTNPMFSLPVTANSSFIKLESQLGISSGWIAHTGVNMFPVNVMIVNSTTISFRTYANTSAASNIQASSGQQVTATAPFTWASGDWFHWAIKYEAA